MTDRRTALKLIGGGVVLAAAAGTGLAIAGAPSTKARVPWQSAGQYNEIRRHCLSYAILAPNPHNRQPWLVRLDGDEALTLFCDFDRRLPVTDPYDRQITIGCGAFLEILRLAARENGYRLDITDFPEGEDFETLDARPICHVRFIEDPSVEPDPLFAHILERRSNKAVYQPVDVPQTDLETLSEAGTRFGSFTQTVGNGQLAEQLRLLTERAHLVEVTTPDAMQESVDLMRIGRAEVAETLTGLSWRASASPPANGWV